MRKWIAVVGAAWLSCSACTSDPGATPEPERDATGGAGGSDSTGSGGATSSTSGTGGGGASGGGGAGHGGVPAFVAYGHAARTLVSCDGGQSFIGEHTFEADGHDHSEYSGLGRMTFGDGWFVGCAGWGNPTRIVRSRDGLTWEDLPDGAFLKEDNTTLRPGAGCSGVVYDGTRFAFVAGGWLYTSPDSSTWTRHAEKVPGQGHIRRVGGGDGLIIYVREDTGAHISDDGGQTWFTGTGYDPACSGSVQRGGGIIVTGNRVLVGGRAGTFCVSSDRGQTFTSVVVNDFVTSMIWDGTQYVASGRKGELFLSSDGLTWTAPGHDADVTLTAIAFNAEDGFVGVADDNDRFFSSGDALTWVAATSDGVEEEKLWTIVAGYVEPSERCPAR